MRESILAACAASFVFVLSAPAGASELFSVQYAGPTPLYKMDQATGAATPIGASGFDGVGDLTSDTRPSSATVWGVRIASKELLTFNTGTGAATSVAALDSTDSIVSLAFDPVGHRLFGNSSFSFGAAGDYLYGIDPATGATSPIGRIGFNDVYALGFAQNGKLYGVSNATSPNQLILIDTATGAGSLVATLQLSNVFDIASRPEDGAMFLAESTSGRLWTLDVSNGVATDVGPYGGDVSPNVVGLAFSAVPEPSTASLALLAGGVSLLARRRRQA